MTETTVAYHRDGFGPGRPAINVKVGMGDRTTYDRIAANPAIGSEVGDIYEWAERRVYDAFWQDAASMAEALGLGDIEQEGRSGGWLVISHGDPADMSGAEQRAWLAGYRALADWCAEQVSMAPAAVDAEAESIAASLAVAP